MAVSVSKNMAGRGRTALLSILTSSLAAAHMFPYVPTQVLTPNSCLDAASHCAGRDIAYIFSQSSDNTVEFRSLNYSAVVDAEVELKTPADKLPFLERAPNTTAFSATRTANGTLVVYAGDCEAGKGEVWSFAEEGGWVKWTMSDDGDGSRAPYFLGGTIAFSTTLAPDMDQPTIYTYGGVCTRPQSSSEDWQSSGNYTKSMMSLVPESERVDTGYTLSVASNAGPRTPMAGFTLTPLMPSMTNKSGVVTQQASYVLLGGHTEQAFINMSTAAVWNLPAESWTYVSIQPPGNSNDDKNIPELAVKDSRSTPEADNVYSRSGHTAVLSEDGSSIVVLGGWAGNVDTPAEPQLAVLEMSEAYSSWKWAIPAKQPDMRGIYGHGAAVLPGNVMMIYGGWEMGAKSKLGRRSVAAPKFLNLTSMSWTDSYKNPSAASSGEETETAPDEQSISKTKKLGLGLGLGLGLPLMFAITFVLLCWRSAHKKRRESRDRAVRALSQDAGIFINNNDMMERDDYMWGANGYYQPGPYENLRGDQGADPGPLHIPRNPVSRPTRGGYVPTAPRPTSYASLPGGIHPIYEDEEEEQYQHNYGQDINTPTSEALDDPFLTPSTAHAPALFPLPPSSRGSATPSPESPRHDPEVQDWVTDVDAAGAMLAKMNTRPGRTSPTRRNSHIESDVRDDESRNGSGLSESARSAADFLSQSPTERRTNFGTSTMGGSTLLGAADVKPGSSGSSSYNTAKSSFHALRAEGPSLLLGRSGTYEEEEPQPPGSPSKSKPRRGWLGSLRRVFSVSSNSTPTISSASPHQMTFDHGEHGDGGDYEPGLAGLRGELLRRKQGRQDWEDGMDEKAPVGGTESDWDIERAVEQRLVQVMFTVPKERLRVVNADEVEGDEEAEGAVVKLPQKAVLVDPEKGSLRSKESGSMRREKGQHREELVEEQRPQTPPNSALRPGLHQPPPMEDDAVPAPLNIGHAHTHSRPHKRQHQRQASDVSSTFLGVETALAEPRLSHETDYSSLGRRSSGVVLEAEAVPMTRERPRTTRVLQMVDSFESLSREASPAGGVSI